MRKLNLLFGVLISVAVIVSCSTATKSLTALPTKLDFDEVNLGDKESLDVIMKNKYGKMIMITGIDLTGSSDFSIVSSHSYPIMLLKNEEFTITIEYDAVTPGIIEGLLAIEHDASTKDKEVKIVGEGVPVPRIDFSTTNYNFGTVLVSSNRTYDIDIENTGTANLTIHSLNVVGAGFSISNGGNTPISVIPNAKHTITVKFEPLSVMQYQAVINVGSDAVNTTPNKIDLQGGGVIVTPKLTLNKSDPWDFGNVVSSRPSTLELQLENTGGDPLTITSIAMHTGTDFKVISIEDSNSTPVSLPQSLQPGAYIVAEIMFDPTVTSLLYDKVVIDHDGINVSSPFELNVQGDGVFVKERFLSYTGGAQSWTVPAGVTSVTIECWGAEGGKADGAGGKGGYAKGDLTVSPGETLNIYVGGKDGWNGGGAGSLGGGTSAGPMAPGANGGGATDVRQGGTTLADRKIVAGGGGGGGGDGAGTVYGPGGNGGAGGGTIGNAGVNGNGGTAGQGGTQTNGGAFGTGNSNCSVTGQSGVAGSLGLGGKGGNGVQGCGGYTGGGGGGAGGGYYGGGGAGGAAAGGGGAWAGGGGGGGSSYIGGVVNGSTQSGIRSGDGEIKISW